jgi:hypothetical protein
MAELRIRTARDGGALVFAIQLDADHDEPLILTLTHTSIALTADLDGAQRAFVALAAVFGADAPNTALSGQVTGKLEVLGTAKAKGPGRDRSRALDQVRRGGRGSRRRRGVRTLVGCGRGVLDHARRRREDRLARRRPLRDRRRTAARSARR